MKVFLLKPGTLLSSIEHSFGSPNYSNQSRKKEIKGNQTGREEEILSLYTDKYI